MTDKAPRSEWPIRDGDVAPGDTIQTELQVKEMPADERHPCDYCSSMEHEGLIQERGVIPADYRLVNHYGVVFGYSCHTCIAESKTTDSVRFPD